MANKVTPLFKDELKLVVNKDLAYNYQDPAVKNWRVTYEVLFNGDTTPTRRVLEFHYFETAMELVKRTEKHCNMIFANIERI